MSSDLKTDKLLIEEISYHTQKMAEWMVNHGTAIGMTNSQRSRMGSYSQEALAVDQDAVAQLDAAIKQESRASNSSSMGM